MVYLLRNLCYHITGVNFQAQQIFIVVYHLWFMQNAQMSVLCEIGSWFFLFSQLVLKMLGYILFFYVIVRTVSRPSICMKIVRPSPIPLSPPESATTNLWLGTLCGFLVFDYAGADVAKYECSMWKILVGLEKFAKVFKSLITFLLKLGKNVEISFWFYIRMVSCGQIRPGASDCMQPDNILLDHISVWTCILSHVLHLTTRGLETAPDHNRVADRTSVHRPLQAPRLKYEGVASGNSGMRVDFGLAGEIFCLLMSPCPSLLPMVSAIIVSGCKGICPLMVFCHFLWLSNKTKRHLVHL